MSSHIFALILCLTLLSCSGNGDADDAADTSNKPDTSSSSDADHGDDAPAIPTRPNDIRGEITRVGDGTPPGSIVVEENPRETSGSLKASVRLPAAARIVRRQGDAIVPLSADELRVGMTVAAWFTGPVAESYPVQATGEYVVVESGE
jgi:hypothetical protein